MERMQLDSRLLSGGDAHGELAFRHDLAEETYIAME
jgi:hypothetical protein